MNYWVFKATPADYDYAEKLRVGRVENWESVKAAELMRVGDRIFFWASAPLLHVAGLGVVTRIPGADGTRVRYLTASFDNPTPIADLKAHPAFKNTRFFKSGSYSTAHLLTEAESRALYDLVIASNPAADIWRGDSEAQKSPKAIDPALFGICTKFSDGLIPLKQARERLEKLGISPGSATNYLYNSGHLLAGRCYKRHMTIAPTTAFLAWIKEHRSAAEYQNSLQALEAHLQYRASSGLRHPRHRELLARLRDLEPDRPDTNWLGHGKGTGAARLDELLLSGATMDELEQTRGAVHSHIRHLREKWGIHCEKVDGKWRMAGTDKPAREDLPDGPPAGCEEPERSTRTVHTYTRNPAVRAYVISRAEGRCEYCGATGFVKPNGESYLEAHHLLALSEDGPDTPDNVVALCANHHREAHYGRERATLEAAVLAKRRGQW